MYLSCLCHLLRTTGIKQCDFR